MGPQGLADAGLSVMKTDTIKQDDRHDWLGDAAESYVAYCFASAQGFEVFGAGKWTADIVVHDTKDDRWWRIEVKSTDKEKPGKKYERKDLAKKLAKKADILTQVSFKKGEVSIKIGKLSTEYGCEHVTPVRDPGDIRKWMAQYMT